MGSPTSVCEFTAGWMEPCKDSIGGIKGIWICAVASEVLNQATFNVKNEVTALPSSRWFQWDLVKHSAKFEQVVTIDETAHTFYHVQTLTLYVPKLTVDKNFELNNAMRGKAVIIVQDNNDNYFLAGHVDGMALTASTITTGQNKGEQNGYIMTFTAQERDSAPFIDPALTPLEGGTFGGTITPASI
jgi:hypothetical protein